MEATSFRASQGLGLDGCYCIVSIKHRSIQSLLLFCSNGSVYVGLLKFRLYMIEIEAQYNFDTCIL